MRAVDDMYDWQMSGSRMKRLALFTDGTHNDTWQCNNYYDALCRFLSEVCSVYSGKHSMQCAK